MSRNSLIPHEKMSRVHSACRVIFFLCRKIFRVICDNLVHSSGMNILLLRVLDIFDNTVKVQVKLVYVAYIYSV